MLGYHLIPDNKNKSLVGIVKKVSDYFISFTGDIEVKEVGDGQIEIKYSNTSYSAVLKTDDDKVILNTHEDDSITINLIKNIASNSGFRIFNTIHNYFLPNDPKLMDISSIGIDKKIYEIFKNADLTPLFQYSNSYIYFCLNEKKEVVLINRHYLEYILTANDRHDIASELFVVVSPDIATFVALFDRGLISLVFPKYQNGDTKVINLSGFDISKLPKDTTTQVTNFRLDKEKQQFIQESTTDKVTNDNYIAMKIGQDYNYEMVNNKLSKVINVSCFYGSD